MNKFKKILLGAVSVLTLGLFVVTGAKVNAATITKTHKLDYTSGSLSKTGDALEVTGSVGGEYSVTTPFAAVSVLTDSEKTFSKGVKMSSGKYVQFSCEYDYTIKVLWSSRNKTDKDYTYQMQATQTPKSGSASTTTSDSISEAKSNTETVNVFEISGNADDTIKIERKSSECILYEIIVVESGEEITEDTYIADAIDAINSIGTVEYTAECKQLIDNATTAVSKVSSTNSITNYSTYESAISTFNSLKSSAVSNFLNAVSNIGTVTESSNTDIETAENLYNILLADELANSDVVSAKNTLDEKKLAYADIMYDSFDKYINANTCTVYENGVSEETQCGNSIFSLLNQCKVNTCNATYDGVTYSQRLQTAGSIGFSGNEVVSKAVKFKTKKAGVLKILAQSAKSGDTTRTLSVYTSGSKTAIYTSANGLPDTTSGIKYDYVSIPSAGTYYIGSSVNNISIYYLEFIETPISVPVLEQQENADNTAIRYIATLSNVSDINEIVSWNATITVDTKNHTFDNQTAVYTAVSGTNGKEVVANTYYLVATLKGIPTTFTGTITCRFNVTLTNGTVQSNIISYTID